MIMVKVAAVMRRAKWDMGTSTPGLAHAIATRRPDRVAPDPRGASAGAPRPAASRWRFGGGRSPGSRVSADHPAFPVRPVASCGGRLATYSCGGSHGLGDRRTVFPSPPRPELRGATAEGKWVKRAAEEHALRLRQSRTDQGR